MQTEEAAWSVLGRRREPSEVQLSAPDGRDGGPGQRGRFAELDLFSEEVARRSLHLLIPGDDEADGSR